MSRLCKAPVILASASRTRAKLLEDTGLAIEIVPASVDEATIRESMAAEHTSAAEIARALAELKALRISRQRPGAFIIGADQILVCNGVLFEKPAHRDAAETQLRALSGASHELISAVCVARDDGVIWHHTDTAQLTMRVLSEGFIKAYLDAAGDEILANVGAYALEGLGAQLFARVRGDYFTILGLPLLPLLDFLREHNIVPR